MLPDDTLQIWKKVYLARGTQFTSHDVGDMINPYLHLTDAGVMYSAYNMVELGYIRFAKDSQKYSVYEFTEKFINEMENRNVC